MTPELHCAPQVVRFTSGRWTMLTGLTPEQKAALKQQLTIVNPRRTSSSRYTGFIDASQPKHLYGFQDCGGDGLLIAPGASASAWKMLTAAGALCYLDDPRRDEPMIPLSYFGQEREYQADTVKQLLARRFGMAVGPCGSGKTDTGIRTMVARQCPWLVIVEKRELRDQWAARILERTGVAASIYSTTKKKRWDDQAPFVIATVQSLIRHPDDVYALDKSRAGVLVDECHHTPASTFTDVLSLLSPRYRIGFTATPDRADGTTALMYWWIGPEVARIQRDVVEASGHLLRAKLELLVTDWATTYDPEEPGDDYRLKLKMYEHAGRRDLIVSRVAHAVAVENRHVIIPVDSITYGYQILEGLRQMDIAAEFCNAKLPKKERRRILESVASGATRALIATSLADEGLDLPILDTTVIATPSGSATRIEQQMGRSCRPLPGKATPLCVYVVDPLVQREEIVTSDSGETTRKIHRIFVNRFRRTYNAVFKAMADCDEVAIRRFLKETCNPWPPSPPAKPSV